MRPVSHPPPPTDSFPLGFYASWSRDARALHVGSDRNHESPLRDQCEALLHPCVIGCRHLRSTTCTTNPTSEPCSLLIWAEIVGDTLTRRPVAHR